MIKPLLKNLEIPYDLLLLADDTKEAIDRYIHDSDIYIYEIDNEAIGIYATKPENPAIIEIKNIAIREDYQGQGIGTILIHDAIKRAIDNGYKTMWIGTGDASFGPLKLYQRLGFEMFEIKKRFFLDNYPNPIFENGIQLKHMVMLKMELNSQILL